MAKIALCELVLRIHRCWPCLKNSFTSRRDHWRAAVQQIEDWLKKLCMSEYARRFADNDIATRFGDLRRRILNW
jgi:hypothetical protein